MQRQCQTVENHQAVDERSIVEADFKWQMFERIRV